MNITDYAKSLIRTEQVKEKSLNILEDLIGAVLGDPISTGKLMLTLASNSFFFREQFFWAKFELFLSGVYLTEDDRAGLCAKLTQDGTNNDNPYRLIACIDRAESKQKVRFLINATRCLCADFIDLAMYFRVCNAITSTLEEDLLFLKNNLGSEDLLYSPCVQGLLTSGLMYQSIYDGNGEQKYSFTPIASLVDQYAISYDDVNRYPNPITKVSTFPSPQISIPSVEWEEITSDEIQNMFMD